MSILEKLLAIVAMGGAIGGPVAGMSMLQRFLSGMAVVVALTIISSIMAGAFLLVVLYAAGATMIAHGLTPPAALLTMAVFILIVALLFFALTLFYLGRLRNIPVLFMRHDAPLAVRLNHVVDSFFRGLMTPPGR
ncbi:MAG: hypothetical protein PHY92_00430 [Alphaproteobacteria bacterium]|nr:hypothetical protein [Alphaproteobacteria bacterium]